MNFKKARTHQKMSGGTVEEEDWQLKHRISGRAGKKGQTLSKG